MKTKLKGVLFDLDETLIDWTHFAQDWREHEVRHLSHVYAFLERKGSPPNVPLPQLAEVFGKRVMEAWSQARATLRAPHLGKILVEVLSDHNVRFNGNGITMEACLEAYQWGALPNVTAFPEVPQVLEKLVANGIRIGIVTNAFQPMTLRDIELEQYGLLQYFTHAPSRITAADAGYLKPHPYIFQHALKAMEYSADEVVFVGDNAVADVAGAQGVGMKAVWRRRATSPRLISGVIVPDAIIDDLNGLLDVLDGWYEGWR
jgi:HAD superfamily hydrolase (TIGR01662 family)